MYSVKIPKVGIVEAATLADLGNAAWDRVHGQNPDHYCYGCSEVGSGWTIKQDGKKIGTMRYNGIFDAVKP